VIAVPKFEKRLSVRAVQAALSLLAAAAAHGEPTVAELTSPESTVEVGVGHVSDYAAKAAEYSGLDRKGAYLIGNFDLRGGGAYDSPDASRWSATGDRLGTRSPSLDLSYGVQGRFRIRLGVDGIQHNVSDTYQSPYLGVGTATLSLPSTWKTPLVPRVSATAPNARGLSPEVTGSNAIISGVSTAPTTAQLGTAAAIQGADLPAFQKVDLYTRRTRVGLDFQQEIGSGWAWTAGLSREHKEGLKLTPAPSRAVGGDTTSLLPAPIDQDDTQFNLGASYTSSAFQVQFGIEGSNFRNNIPSLTWDLWADRTVKATESTAPGNDYYRATVSTAWRLMPTTRIVANASFATATQNEDFLKDTSALWVPSASANARVDTQAASVKLLHQASTDLRLSATYNFNFRDNRTPVQTFGYYDADNPAAGTSPFAYLFPTLTGLGSAFNINANTPYSKRSNRLDLDADYKLGADSQLSTGVRTEQTDRFCRGSWINCADSPDSQEQTGHLALIGSVTDTLSARARVEVARRHVRYDENAFLAVVPMANYSPSTATGALAGTTAYGALTSLGFNGWGPVSGLQPAFAATTLQGFYFPLNNVLSNSLYGNQNRISELPGLRRYNQADRDREKLGSTLQWQASDQLNLTAGVEYTDDSYRKSRYGLQRVTGHALNLDAAYALGDDTLLNVFSTYEMQHQRQAGNTYTANSAAANVNGATAVSGGCFATIALRNAQNKIDPCEDWTSKTRDRTITLGGSFTRNRLMSGRLDLSASAVYSLARTTIDFTGGSYVNNPYAGIAANPTGTVAAYYIPATQLPASFVKALDLRASGTYHLTEGQALRLAYAYQRLSTIDWAYEGLNPGGPTQFLPTFEQTPRHEVHTVGLSYVYSFR
jgi:MtrB/PioB family decaheme-associated outer membrane protein